MNVRVSLSSGESFWVQDATVQDLAGLLNSNGLVWVGSRLVNAAQVAQVEAVHEIPSVAIPERLVNEEAV